jgi:hypothetical protein
MNVKLMKQLTKAIVDQNVDCLSQLSFDICYEQSEEMYEWLPGEKLATLVLIDACIKAATGSNEVKEYMHNPVLRQAVDKEYKQAVAIPRRPSTVGRVQRKADDFGREQRLDAWADNREVSSPYE